MNLGIIPNGMGTYVALGIFALALIAEGALGVDVPSFEAGDNWLQTLWTVVIGGYARRAVGNKLSGPV